VQRGLLFYVKPYAPNAEEYKAFLHLYNQLFYAEDTIIDDHTFTEAWKKLLLFVSDCHWRPYMPRQNQRPQHVLGKDGDGVAASGTLKIKIPFQHTHTHTHTQP